MRRVGDHGLGPGLEKHLAEGIAVNVPTTRQMLDELAELIQQRECAVELLPEGEVRHRVLVEIAQLRRRAETARLKAADTALTADAGRSSAHQPSSSH